MNHFLRLTYFCEAIFQNLGICSSKLYFYFLLVRRFVFIFTRKISWTSLLIVFSSQANINFIPITLDQLLSILYNIIRYCCHPTCIVHNYLFSSDCSLVTTLRHCADITPYTHNFQRLINYLFADI